MTMVHLIDSYHTATASIYARRCDSRVHTWGTGDAESLSGQTTADYEKATCRRCKVANSGAAKRAYMKVMGWPERA